MIRNRKAQDEAMAWRSRIYGMLAARTQAEPRLTVEEIRRQCDYQLSAISVKRHRAWLRANGYLIRDGSFLAEASS